MRSLSLPLCNIATDISIVSLKASAIACKYLNFIHIYTSYVCLCIIIVVVIVIINGSEYCSSSSSSSTTTTTRLRLDRHLLQTLRQNYISSNSAASPNHGTLSYPATSTPSSRNCLLQCAASLTELKKMDWCSSVLNQEHASIPLQSTQASSSRRHLLIVILTSFITATVCSLSDSCNLFHVCNPATKKWAHLSRRPTASTQFVLSCDPYRSPHYKVTSFPNETDHFEVYSSETEEQRDITRVEVPNILSAVQQNHVVISNEIFYVVSVGCRDYVDYGCTYAIDVEGKTCRRIQRLELGLKYGVHRQSLGMVDACIMLR